MGSIMPQECTHTSLPNSWIRSYWRFSPGAIMSCHISGDIIMPRWVPQSLPSRTPSISLIGSTFSIPPRATHAFSK